MDIFLGIMKDLPMYLGLLNGVLMAIIAVCMVIPGEQPEKAMQGIVDFIKNFSAKPK